MQQLILGSSSPFRAELLKKLGLPFIAVSPDIDEQILPGESPEQLVRRLAIQKAQAIAGEHTNALIIGSDQVAVIDNTILGKPGTHENAVKQLQNASGKTVQFLTGLALFNGRTDEMQAIVEPFDVSFKLLSDDEIHFYLEKEQPYQCVGSFKSEGLGISLFTTLNGEDPNALIGLPLIRLITLLRTQGVDVLKPNH